jgi:hypothetical protein
MTYAQGYLYCPHCGAPKERETQPCPHCGPIPNPIRANVVVLPPPEEKTDNSHMEITAFVLMSIITLLIFVNLYMVIMRKDPEILIFSSVLVILCTIEVILYAALKKYVSMSLQLLNLVAYMAFVILKSIILLQ